MPCKVPATREGVFHCRLDCFLDSHVKLLRSFPSHLMLDNPFGKGVAALLGLCSLISKSCLERCVVLKKDPLIIWFVHAHLRQRFKYAQSVFGSTVLSNLAVLQQLKCSYNCNGTCYYFLNGSTRSCIFAISQKESIPLTGVNGGQL